jgi:acyl carrier protein
MTQLVVFLEQQFNVNFAEVSFEVEMIDSVNEIEDFLKQFVS